MHSPGTQLGLRDCPKLCVCVFAHECVHACTGVYACVRARAGVGPGTGSQPRWAADVCCWGDPRAGKEERPFSRSEARLPECWQWARRLTWAPGRGQDPCMAGRGSSDEAVSRVCKWTGSLLAAGRQPSPSSPSSLMHAPGLARAASPPNALDCPDLQTPVSIPGLVVPPLLCPLSSPRSS